MGPGEPELLESFYFSAIDYMSNAGVSLPKEGSPRRATYDLLVNAMVLSDWDNRAATVTAPVTENVSFRRRLNQLKETEVPDLGT